MTPLRSPHPLQRRVAIVGVGESDIGHLPHMSGLALNAQAASRALDDAGLRPQHIDGLLTAYSLTEPYFMMGSVLAEYLGLQPRLNASMVVGGATPGVMIHHAAQAIACGQAETVLVCAGENRASGQSRDDALAALSTVGHPYFELPYGLSIPAAYAMIARRHMAELGTTEAQLAAVAVTARAHAALHPNAHKTAPISVADVLQSKPIADPLKLLDCCLISDAGGAVIVTSAERARDLTDHPVLLAGIGEFHTHEHLLCAPSLTTFGSRQSGAAAYAMAGLTPADVDVAELYDCFSVVPLIEAEDLGLCPRGGAASHFAEGHARIGGRLPMNTHGGLLSHAHAGAAGGLFGVIEAVRQLRGGQGLRQVANAQVALVHNEGGILSSHCTMLFTRDGL